MQSPRPSPFIAPRTFFVERYVTQAAPTLASAVARAAAMCRDTVDGSLGVRYLMSTYLPTEEICFCVFQALNAQAVLTLNEAVAFPIGRITEASLMLPARLATATSPPPRPSTVARDAARSDSSVPALERNDQ